MLNSVLQTVHFYSQVTSHVADAEGPWVGHPYSSKIFFGEDLAPKASSGFAKLRQILVSLSLD